MKNYFIEETKIMKKQTTLVICSLLFAILLSACSQTKSDGTTKQLIEVMNSNGKIVRQETDNEKITALTKNEQIQEWTDVDSIPEKAENLYEFTTYMLVTDPAYKSSSDSEIDVDKETLYYDGENYYLKENDFSQSTAAFNMIPYKAGTYLVDFAKNTSETMDKDTIFASWGVEDYNLILDSQNTATESESISEKDDEPIAAEISGVKKISISFSEDNVITIDDTEEISSFYHTLSPGTWAEIDVLPSDTSEICTIRYYQPGKKTLDKSLIENESMSLYQIKGEYFICDEIPENNSGNPSMDSYYKIPDTVGKYIMDLNSRFHFSAFLS
ncbi:MAG: hypothetical protein PHY47_17770 [Lachnospiraceae bacterium]|nr:hypothetical protein [Lachnospiraceae bacterium]